jgi:hypothetical protein
VNDTSEYNFLFVILRTTTITQERHIVFNILELLLTKGDFPALHKQTLGILEEYNYKETTDFSTEEHSAICNLTVLIIMANKREKATYPKILEIFYQLCSDFNKISNYKLTNIDRINNFGYCIGRLGAKVNLRTLSEDSKCSDAFDDLITKLIELVDNKDLDINFRKVCIEDYLMNLFKNTDEYLDHVKYLREQYIEYDQYDLHQAIGYSASQLLRKDDLEEFFADLVKNINSKDSTLIAKRACIMHLAQFIMNSELVKEFQDKLITFQAIFFKYMFDKKDLIQE